MTETLNLNINQIILNSLGGAMRTLLRNCAERINNEFHTLCLLDDNERLEAIIKTLGLDEEDYAKVVKPAKKETGTSEKAPRKTKPKAEKKIPVPFWIYKDKTTKTEVSTVNTDLCHGLTAGLYSQCTNKPIDGCNYCKKCKKEADSNEGVPKRGCIEDRIEQFEADKYVYTPPGGKPKKIYPLEWAIKNKYTEEEFDAMLVTLNMNPATVKLVKLIPEKKPRATKKTDLTEDITEEKPTDKKTKKLEPEPEPEPEDEDDDAKSETSDYSHATTIDDDGVPFAEDEDEDEEEIDATPVNPTPDECKILSVKKGDKMIKYAVKREDTNSANYNIYEVSDYVGSKNFKIAGNGPIGCWKNGKVMLGEFV